LSVRIYLASSYIILINQTCHGLHVAAINLFSYIRLYILYIILYTAMAILPIKTYTFFFLTCALYDSVACNTHGDSTNTPVFLFFIYFIAAQGLPSHFMIRNYMLSYNFVFKLKIQLPSSDSTFSCRFTELLSSFYSQRCPRTTSLAVLQHGSRYQQTGRPSTTVDMDRASQFRRALADTARLSHLQSYYDASRPQTERQRSVAANGFFIPPNK